MSDKKFPLQEIYRERLRQILSGGTYSVYTGEETSEEMRIGHGQKLIIEPKKITLGEY